MVCYSIFHAVVHDHPFGFAAGMTVRTGCRISIPVGKTALELHAVSRNDPNPGPRNSVASVGMVGGIIPGQGEKHHPS